MYHEEQFTKLMSVATKLKKMPRNCQVCGKSYYTLTSLAKHKRQFHDDVRIECEHCGELYTSVEALRLHIRTHNLPCKCNLCSKAFSHRWSTHIPGKNRSLVHTVSVHLRTHPIFELIYKHICT